MLRRCTRLLGVTQERRHVWWISKRMVAVVRGSTKAKECWRGCSTMLISEVLPSRRLMMFLEESCSAWDSSRRRVRFASHVETFAIWESVAPSVELLSCDSDKAKVETCDALPLPFVASRASSRFGAQSYAVHTKADVEQDLSYAPRACAFQSLA